MSIIEEYAKRRCAGGMSMERPKNGKVISGFFLGASTSGDSISERGRPTGIGLTTLKSEMIQTCLERD